MFQAIKLDKMIIQIQYEKSSINYPLQTQWKNLILRLHL